MNSIEFNSRAITGSAAVSNVFNNYFTSIAEKTKYYTAYLSNTNTNTFVLTPTEKKEISVIISPLNSNKSSGSSSILPKLLKLLKNGICQQLSDTFKMSFSTVQFPSVLIIAKVFPIHKKQSKVDYTNYRPISLLPNIEKIIEKLMYRRLFNFLGINNLIYSSHFRFQQNRSTTDALINFTESIMQALDDGSFGCGISEDLQKAFDTIGYKILLHKLEYYGMRGVSMVINLI